MVRLFTKIWTRRSREIEHCSLKVVILEVKKGVFALGLWGLALVGALAGQPWHIDYEVAKQIATDQKKDLLVVFTSARNRAWTTRFREGVLQTDVFEEGAKKHFVLVDVKVPHRDVEMEEKTRIQNEQLQERFWVERTPVVYLCDPTGHPYARTLYWRRGPDTYLDYVNGLRAARERRDAAFAASRGEGTRESRAMILQQALRALPFETLPEFYKTEIGELADLDPENKLVAAVTEMREDRLEAGIVNPYFNKKDYLGLVKRVEEEIVSQKLEGVRKQRYLRHVATAQSAMHEYDQALETTKRIEAIKPGSDVGRYMRILRGKILREKAAYSTPAPAPGSKKPGAQESEIPRSKIPGPPVP
jgi:hypothetical protein